MKFPIQHQSESLVLYCLIEPAGRFIEDYEYSFGLGDLDQYNGRFCKTPDFPDGRYCYFVTIDTY